MANLNKVIVAGNLGRDPEIRHTGRGDCVCHLHIATTDRWLDKASGEKREQTEWHRVVLFRKLAEVAAEYLRKGAPVYVEGHLKTHKWTDAKAVDHYQTEIFADKMQMLGASLPRPVTEIDERGVQDGDDDPLAYQDAPRPAGRKNIGRPNMTEDIPF